MKSNPLAAVVPQSHREPVVSNDGQKGGTCVYLGAEGLFLCKPAWPSAGENAEQFLERIKHGEKVGNILREDCPDCLGAVGNPLADPIFMIVLNFIFCPWPFQLSPSSSNKDFQSFHLPEGHSILHGPALSDPMSWKGLEHAPFTETITALQLEGNPPLQPLSLLLFTLPELGYIA